MTHHVSVSHHDKLIQELRDAPDFASAYLAAALDEAEEPGGREALLLALRQLTEAHGGMTQLAEQTGMRREALYRALSPRGNPTLTTLLAVFNALDLKLALTPRHAHAA
ncbi:addiction module antidote protein [Vogesella sp. LIG4]|uniref:addiction module antidote protein n=1 Tax=Vogesella sp. LIG4 TaxID=1192162 RepID=UPI00081F756E|nr:addiction module antidote protein [Vogesella sp. LIG4]SCK09159.1 probable addiction module antidote protein [Vogesella sp. LIG4]